MNDKAMKQLARLLADVSATHDRASLNAEHLVAISASVRQLSQTLMELRRENAELRQRVEALEAKLN